MFRKFFLILALTTSSYAAFGCNPSTSEKNACENSDDCSGARECNFDDEAGEGTCMEAYNGFFVCGPSDPCPGGQFCFNGLCAPGCLTDDDCADNQYCDTEFTRLCVNKEVPTCTGDTDCAPSQECVLEMCSATPEESVECELGTFQDGCDDYSICLDMSDVDYAKDPECVSFPPCAEDGTCPVGQYGAVCNHGYQPEKEAICLTGMCVEDSNCPSDWSCAHVSWMGGTLGICSNGSAGSPCGEPDDCDDGLDCMSGVCFGTGF